MAIAFNSVPDSARASKIYIELMGQQRTLASFFIPPTALVVGMYATSKTSVVANVPVKVASKDDGGNKFGFGSHIHRQLLMFPNSVFDQGGGVYVAPVAQESGGTAANETVTFAGDATSAGTFFFNVGNDLVSFAVPSGTTDDDIATLFTDAISAKQNLPVTAADATAVTTVTAKFKGLAGNDILIVQNPSGESQSAQAPAGVTVTIENSDGYLDGGTTDPSVEDVFFDSEGNDALGDRWYTSITCPFTDATNLGFYDTSGDLRSDPATNRFFGAHPGYVKETYAQALAKPATINSKWIGPIWDPRYRGTPSELGAALVGTILDEQNAAPNRPYKTLEVEGSFDNTIDNLRDSQYQALFVAGMSYCEVVSDVLRFGDIALSYRTNESGGTTEEWFDAQQLYLRQAKAYSLEEAYKVAQYSRSVVVDNNTVASNVTFAVSPADVVSTLTKLILDLWQTYAWSKNIDTIIASLTAEINGTYDARIDGALTDDAARALRIIAIRYGYYY